MEVTNKVHTFASLSKTESNMVAVVQLVRASDCGSECRRFESDQPPQERNLSFSLFLFSFYKFTLEYIGLTSKVYGDCYLKFSYVE